MSSNAIISGYTGVYRQPYVNQSTYGDTIYVVTNAVRQELNMILLSPGAYKDAYMIASTLSYQRINIFAPSIDDIFISDIYRLVFDLSKIKKCVKFVFPERPNINPSNMLFDRAILQLSNFASTGINDLTVEYYPSAKDGLYDIAVYDGNRYDYFSLHMSAEMYTALMTKGATGVDYVNIPYAHSIYGGLSAKECALLNPMWRAKVVANNFACREEFNQALSEQLCVQPSRAWLLA